MGDTLCGTIYTWLQVVAKVFTFWMLCLGVMSFYFYKGSQEGRTAETTVLRSSIPGRFAFQ